LVVVSQSDRSTCWKIHRSATAPGVIAFDGIFLYGVDEKCAPPIA